MTVEVVGAAVLRNFPLRVWKRQQEHTYDLLREFQLLLTSSGATAGHELPRKLLSVADDFVTRYGAYSASITAEREAAVRAGEVTIDSVVPLLAETPELVESVGALLREVDEYCRNGDLLTLATPSEVDALRTWTLSEMLRQFHGEAASPWAGRVD